MTALFRLSLMVWMFLFTLVACDDAPKKKTSTTAIEQTKKPIFKLSLAQWSFHRAISSGEMSPYDFAKRAKELGFEGLEYVSGLYREDLEGYPTIEEGMEHFITESKEQSEKYGLQNVLIMVDGEGDLASEDEAIRDKAIANHKKWVLAAKTLGCHAIRVNLSGSQELEKWTEASVDGLSRLADFAAGHEIEVIVENHGGFSSNGMYLSNIIKKVNKSNCGTLPDFGNFCIKWKKGGCEEWYDRYKGITELMPYAKAVSAKSHDFKEDGEEADMDYTRILKIVKDAGYRGFVGVEYEGTNLGEEEGTIKTRDLIIRVMSKL